MKQFLHRDGVVVFVTLVLACLPVVIAGLYLYQKYQWATDRITEVTPRYARLTGLLANKDNLAQANTRAADLLAQYVHPVGPDASQLGNEVQQRIRNVLSAAGLSIVSTQVLAAKDDKDDKDFERIPLTVRAEGELMHTQLALAALNEQKPAVVVDGFVVQAAGAPVKGVQKLAVQLNLVILRSRK